VSGGFEAPWHHFEIFAPINHVNSYCANSTAMMQHRMSILSHILFQIWSFNAVVCITERVYFTG
jgi:hypothetical protein